MGMQKVTGRMDTMKLTNIAIFCFPTDSHQLPKQPWKTKQSLPQEARRPQPSHHLFAHARFLSLRAFSSACLFHRSAFVSVSC